MAIKQTKKNKSSVVPLTLAQKLARKKELEKEQFLMMKDLYGHYRNGTFLSIDIVGSTKVKEGEDSLVITQSFQNFHRYINENLYGSLGSVFSGDGVMVLFEKAQEAVNAALRIYRGLEDFNKNESKLRGYLNVRIGVNSGTMLIDDSMELGRLTERNVDIAGHLQKYADPGQLLISAFTWEQIGKSDAFKKMWKTIDNTIVFQYHINFTPVVLLTGWNQTSRRIKNKVDHISHSVVALRSRIKKRHLVYIGLVIGLIILLVSLYSRVGLVSTEVRGLPKLVKDKICRMETAHHLGDVRYREKGKWFELPDIIYLVIPPGLNSVKNKAHGIKEGMVVALRRGSDRRYYLVRLGVFETYVETFNGYRIFLQKEDAHKYARTLD